MYITFQASLLPPHLMHVYLSQTEHSKKAASRFAEIVMGFTVFLETAGYIKFICDYFEVYVSSKHELSVYLIREMGSTVFKKNKILNSMSFLFLSLL